MTMTEKKPKPQIISKKWLYGSLVALALIWGVYSNTEAADNNSVLNSVEQVNIDNDNGEVDIDMENDDYDDDNESDDESDDAGDDVGDDEWGYDDMDEDLDTDLYDDEDENLL